jgi:hypothetical protein
MEDHGFADIPHAGIKNRDGMDIPPLCVELVREQRRQLGSQPDDHPTRTGWSISRAA